MYRSSSILLFNTIFETLLIVILSSIDEELRKNAKVQEKRSKTAEQPAQVDQDISAVNSTSLSRSAFLAVLAMVADGVEGEDAEHIGQVSNTGEEEEKSIETFGALAAVVEEQLRYATAEIEGSTQVTKYLADNVEVQAVVLLFFSLVAAVG